MQRKDSDNKNKKDCNCYATGFHPLFGMRNPQKKLTAKNTPVKPNDTNDVQPKSKKTASKRKSS